MDAPKFTLVAVTALVVVGMGSAYSGIPDVAVTDIASSRSVEPTAVVDRFFDLLAKGDTNAASALLDPSVLIYESGGVEHSRGEYAAHHLTADAAGDLAWVATEPQLAVPGKATADAISTETMILRRQPSGWRIVHIHWSSQSAAH